MKNLIAACLILLFGCSQNKSQLNTGESSTTREYTAHCQGEDYVILVMSADDRRVAWIKSDNKLVVVDSLETIRALIVQNLNLNEEINKAKANQDNPSKEDFSFTPVKWKGTYKELKESPNQ